MAVPLTATVPAGMPPSEVDAGVRNGNQSRIAAAGVPVHGQPRPSATFTPWTSFDSAMLYLYPSGAEPSPKEPAAAHVWV